MPEKPTLTPIAVNDWDERLDGVVADMHGRPLNVHGLMAHNPALLEAWWGFRNYSVSGGSLGDRAGELVILRTAHHMDAWYEWASHVVRGRKAGLSLEEIQRVKDGPGAGGWSAEDAALLCCVDDLVAHDRIADATLAEAARFYSAAQLLDLLAIHGMYVTLGRMINTWGLELDEHTREALPAAFDTGA